MTTTFRKGLGLVSDAGLDSHAHRLSRLLLALHDKAGTPPATVRGLAAHLGVPASSVTRGADRLVLEDLAIREEDAKDRRSVFIKLTPRGVSLAKSLAA